MLEAVKDMVTEAGAQRDFIERYIPLVDFLGQAMGPNVEVVLHDLDVPDRSVVAIANSHISGRKIGGPVTDFALWFMKQGNAERVPMLTGYRAINAEGRVCRSSSYFLRDENNVMRGMLCINVDMSDWLQMQKTVSHVLDSVGFTQAPEKTEAFGGYLGDRAQDRLQQPGLTTSAEPVPDSGRETGEPVSVQEEVAENLRSDVQNLLESMLDKAIAQHGVSVERLQRDERLRIVSTLEESGFFILKGGISAAAERLGVSEPTIYRDLVRARNQA